MRRLTRLMLCLALLVGLPAGAVAAQHLNAYSLQPDFMCVLCHEPLNQVNDPESATEKQTLQQLAASGLDLSQIKTQMVADYGENVLARPPARGLNLLVYILPPLVLIGGLVFLGYNLPRWRTRARAAAALEQPLEPAELDAADAARLADELSEFDA